MPLYDLMCSCGYTKEYMLKLEEQEPVCDVCGLQMKKAISAPAFILKGGCWGSDGYSRANKTKPPKKKGGKDNA